MVQRKQRFEPTIFNYTAHITIFVNRVYMHRYNRRDWWICKKMMCIPLHFQLTAFSVLHCLNYDLEERRCSQIIVLTHENVRNQIQIDKVMQITLHIQIVWLVVYIACFYRCYFVFVLQIFVLMKGGGLKKVLVLLLLVAGLFHSFSIYFHFLSFLVGWNPSVGLITLNYINTEAFFIIGNKKIFHSAKLKIKVVYRTKKINIEGGKGEREKRWLRSEREKNTK